LKINIESTSAPTVFRIKHVSTGRYLTVTSGTEGEIAIWAVDNVGDPYQRWYFDRKDFFTETYVVPSSSPQRTVTIRGIYAKHDDISIVTLSGSNSVRESGRYGVNSTYFRPNAGVINLAGIAVYNGAQVKDYGTMNRDPRGGYATMMKCGTMVCPKTSTTGIIVVSDVIDKLDGWTYALTGEKFTVANTKWATIQTAIRWIYNFV